MLKESTVIQIAINMHYTLMSYKERWNKTQEALKSYEVAYGKDIEESVKELNSVKDKIKRTCIDMIDACYGLAIEFKKTYKLNILEELERECDDILRLMK